MPSFLDYSSQNCNHSWKILDKSTAGCTLCGTIICISNGDITKYLGLAKKPIDEPREIDITNLDFLEYFLVLKNFTAIWNEYNLDIEKVNELKRNGAVK